MIICKELSVVVLPMLLRSVGDQAEAAASAVSQQATRRHQTPAEVQARIKELVTKIVTLCGTEAEYEPPESMVYVDRRQTTPESMVSRRPSQTTNTRRLAEQEGVSRAAITRGVAKQKLMAAVPDHERHKAEELMGCVRVRGIGFVDSTTLGQIKDAKAGAR